MVSILSLTKQVNRFYNAGEISAILKIMAAIDNNSDVGIDVNSHLVAPTVYLLATEYALSSIQHTCWV